MNNSLSIHLSAASIFCFNLYLIQTTYHSQTEVSFIVPAGEGRNKSVSITVDGQTSNENTEFNYNGK